MINYLFFLLLSYSLATSNAATPNHEGPTKLIYQFPNETRVENVAVRSNGHLLLSFITQPELHAINPLIPNPKPHLVYKFPNSTGVFGITEIEPDIFAVAAGNLSLLSFFIWTVNFQGPIPKVHKAVDIPVGGFINGVARLSRNTILGSDVLAGLVYRIDLYKGTTAIVIENETMEDSPGFAINGIRIDGKYLYYVNFGKGLFCRVPIDLRTGTAAGPVEIISDAVRGADDFALSNTAHTAYIANVLQNSLIRVAADGETEVIAGGPDGTLFIGPTSAQLGRTLLDRNVVYVVSSGAAFNPSTGSFDSVEGGKIVAVKLGRELE